VGPHPRIAIGLLVLGQAGCLSPAGRTPGCPPPAPAVSLVDRDAPADTVPVVDLRTAAPRPDARPGDPAGPARFNVLVLSGGGAYGAYPAGVLAGWSEAGTRPDFDVITGVSTGALVGTLAFLGPARDPDLKRFYTRLTDRDVFARRPGLAALLSDALADSRPLGRLIDRAVDADLLRQVAAEHAKGRRLYVGTTHLDARRLVVWDMGAIASRGRPEDLALFRKVLLASASLPGLLPPVAIPVEVDDKRYEELHADGGVTASLFFRPPHVPRAEAAALGDRPLAGSNLYVIVAGKLYADPEPVEPRFVSIVSSSVSALLYAQTRGDLAQLHALAQATGMNYRVAAVPQAIPVPAAATTFDPAAMHRLYEAGRRQAGTAGLWRSTPPGSQPGEDVPVRAGTRLTPAPPAGPPVIGPAPAPRTPSAGVADPVPVADARAQ
jgi:predicted acylesterase/phospholipase RssA